MVAPTAPLQVAPQAGTLPQLVGTFVVSVLFFSLTAHVAARYVLGDVPIRRALLVGLVPALTTTVLIRYPPIVIIALTVVCDFLAIQTVYRLAYRTTALVTGAHFTLTVLTSLVVAYALAIFSTAPV